MLFRSVPQVGQVGQCRQHLAQNRVGELRPSVVLWVAFDEIGKVALHEGHDDFHLGAGPAAREECLDNVWLESADVSDGSYI